MSDENRSDEQFDDRADAESSHSGEGFVDLDGCRTYYQRRGSGPPLVFVHGWSLDLEYWRPQIEFFSRDYEVWAYDLRGMGQSNGARPPYDFDRLVNDLSAFLDHFSIESPIVCGHSLGGTIVAQLAVDQPERMATMVLADAPGKPNLWINPLASIGLNIGVALFRLLGISNPLRPLTPLFVRLFFSRDFRREHPEVIDAWHQQYLSNSIPGVLNSFRAEAWRENLKSRLGAVVASTLVMRGSKDCLVSEREVEVFADGIAGAELELVENSGHMTLTEQPANFCRIMKTFLDQIAPSETGETGETGD